MKTNKFWSYSIDSRFLLALLGSVFLWVVVMPDGSGEIISYTMARNIVRHGCAASIDDNQKLHVCPNYIILGRIKHYMLAILLGLGLAGVWQSLALAVQNPTETTRKLYQNCFSSLVRQLFSYPMMSHGRPPPAVVF